MCCLGLVKEVTENKTLCRTPLFASVVANVINFGLDLFLMFVLGWGVAGAAIATSVSQYVSFFILYWRMRATKMLLASHVRDVPSKEDVAPFLKVKLIRAGSPHLAGVAVLSFAFALKGCLAMLLRFAFWRQVLQSVWKVVGAFALLVVNSGALV